MRLRNNSKGPNSKFKFNFVSKETLLKLLQDLYENKAVSFDNLSAKFLKDGATVLTKRISQICKFSIKYSIFPSGFKIAKLKPLFKKGSKTAPKIIFLIRTSFSFENNRKSYSRSNTKFSRQNDIIYRYQSGIFIPV